MPNLPCGHSTDHLVSGYCFLCATDPVLGSWMASSDPGDKLPVELHQAGEQALLRFVVDYRYSMTCADQHTAGIHPADYKFNEASRLELAKEARWRAEDTLDEADRLARALGYEVFSPPAAPRWQAADGRKVYL